MHLRITVGQIID